jgi:ribosomal protein L16/L10AE
LLNRLTDHANGKVELTESQVNAARIVIGKAIPDLKSMEIKGDPDAPIQVVTEVRRTVVDPEPRG